MTASQPFTTALAASSLPELMYSWVWNKSRFANQMLAKVQPLKVHEDVLVFSKGKPNYNAQGLVEINKTTKQGARVTDNNGGGIRKTEYTQRFTGWPRSVLAFNSEGKTVHPTQKPVALFAYLIQTYTNHGETVLDFCAGSGTTAVAAENTGRRWVCIEREEKYCEVIAKRLSARQKPLLEVM